MSKSMAPDQAARNQIANQLEANFLVEAGAGSGKTTSLVNRMVNLILSGSCEVSEIAAITFTRKAANELRERFQIALEKRFRAEQDTSLKARLERALLELDQCFLGTIHAFCARLLRERPIEAQIDPAFQELDESQDQRIKELVWHRYLQEMKSGSPEKLAILYRLGINPLDLLETFVELTRYPDVEIVREETEEPAWRPVLNNALKLVSESAHAIRMDEIKENHKFEKSILGCLQQSKYLDQDHVGEAMKWIRRLHKQPKVTQKCWTSKDDAKHYEGIFTEFKENQIDPLVASWLVYCHYHIVEFLLPAMKRYQEYKLDQSLVNFEDLLLKTSFLLREHPEVRAYFQNKIRVLLVDEFQDTDPVQAQIMFYLTGENLYETDWKKTNPKPGTLFVVGDPKQAIYRFRRADIDTYNLVKKLVTESDGETLALTTNFRSLKPIADTINPIFQTYLPMEENQYQAAFQPLQAMREDEDGMVSGVATYVITDECKKKEDIVQKDAESIAKYIKWAMAGNIQLARTDEEKSLGVSPIPSPKDFMILLRYKDSMEVYSRMLDSYGIPNMISGGSSFTTSTEVREIHKLAKFLADIDNGIHFVSVLKGEFFGLSDETLYQWKRSGGNLTLFAEVPETLAEEHRVLVEIALQKLRTYATWTRKLAPVAALEKMITDIGLFALVASKPLNNVKCAYLHQLLEYLRGPLAKEIVHFSDLAQAIGNLLESDIEEELNLLGEEQDAVQIMNLHKAKGLEAPVIFLAHPAKLTDPTERVSKHIKRDGDTPKGYFTFMVSKGEHQHEVIGQPSNWDIHKEEEGCYLNEEETRLLYVAATRAKNLLLISTSAKDNKKNPWDRLATENLPEVQIPEIDIPEPANSGKSMTQEMVITGKELYQDWQTSIVHPTYRLTTPTEAAEEKMKSFAIERESGGGKNWGSIVHRVFEVLVQSKGNIVEMDTFIEMALTDHGESPSRKEELLQVLVQFLHSTLWQRIVDSDEVYTEVPFSTKVEGDPDEVVTGIIDLVIKEQAGWTIIDYKTDRVQKKEEIGLLLEHYKPQVQTYARIWEKLTGNKVCGAEIYLVEEDKTLSILDASH